jgi:dTDP-4-dehydrorhamnose 3,5-epimerase
LVRCKTIKKDGKNIPNFFNNTPDQIFISKTKSWHGRGLHFQKNNPLIQTVTVLDGKIYECLVETIKTKYGNKYKTYKGIISSSDKLNSFIIPKGWAHGFFTKSKEATIIYQIWGSRSVNDEYGYNLKDIKFGFLDKIDKSKIKLNRRDREYKLIE